MLIETNNQRYETRDKFQQDAVRLALQSNDKRLETMNEFRGALADQSALMIPRSESNALRVALVDKSDEQFKALNTRIDTEFQPLHEKIAQVGRPNWMLLAALLSIVLVMTGGIWLVIGLKIDASLTPVQVELENLRVADAGVADSQKFGLASAAASTQSDSLSRADRLQLNSRLQLLEATVGALTVSNHGTEVKTAAALVEIETQFKAASTVINIQKDETEKMFGLLWPKVFPGSTLYGSRYRPNLYKEN